MRAALLLPVQAISTHREGYQPFKSTIADRLDSQARESVLAAHLRDDLEAMRQVGRKKRNHR